MAVGLGDDGVPAQIGGLEVRVPDQEFRQRQDLSPQRLHILVPGQQLGGVRAPHAGATRLNPDDGDPAGNEPRQHGGRVPELAAGAVELPRRDPRQAAASPLVQDLGLVAEPGQDLHHRRERPRLEAVAERVHPDQDRPLGAARGEGRAATGRPRCEPGDLTPAIDPGSPFHDRPEPRCGAHDIDQRPEAGDLRDEPSPARQPAQRVVVARPQPSLETLVGDTRLIGGHVDAGGAVAGASLARQAQVQCLGHLRGSPSIGDEGAVDHLLQRPGPAPGGVLLVTGGLIAGAHHPAGRGGVGQAFPNPGALVHLGHERGICHIERRDGGSHHPEIRVRGSGVDQHPGVEQVLGVEQMLDLAEQPQRLGGIHPGEQFRAGAPVTVLAGHRPAVRGHQLGRLQHEGAVPGLTVRGLEGKVDAGMDAAVAEVAVGHRV